MSKWDNWENKPFHKDIEILNPYIQFPHWEKQLIESEDYYNLAYLYKEMFDWFDNPLNKIWASNNLIFVLKKLGLNDEALELQINTLQFSNIVHAEDDNTKSQRQKQDDQGDYCIYQYEFPFSGLTGEDGYYDWDYTNYL